MADKHQQGVLQAGKNLKNFIDKNNVLCSNKDGMKRPLLILALDEAHNLTEFVGRREWSIYSELRRCLCQLLGLPFFTLFLSTGGKFRLFSPEKEWDPSSRVVRGAKRVLPPITETGFDHFAETAIEGQTTLDQVVEDKWVYSLGRPLCVFLALHSVGGPTSYFM